MAMSASRSARTLRMTQMPRFLRRSSFGCALRRPNLMVKIPATKAGIPAIRKAIAAGVNVNVTLIFSLTRYAEVMDAYLSGLEDRAAAGNPIDHIASVASFFVSRVDSKVDPAPRWIAAQRAKPPSPTPNSPTTGIIRPSPAAAGRNSRLKARASSVRCGRAPAPRIPTIPIRSTSTNSSVPKRSTPSRRKRSMPSRITAR
jgi:hypothetical protein